MAVAAHLHIRLEEYDERIRTFVPGYTAMIEVAAATLATVTGPRPHVVDLGTGTGALARRCLDAVPGVRLTAIDEDAAIMALARERLKDAAEPPAFVHGSFASTALPPCDALVASLSLHHIRTAEAKQAFYARCRAVLPVGGVLINADCAPATDETLRAAQFAAWRAHLQQSYGAAEADGFLAAWAEEDVYFPLDEERAMLAAAGFASDLVWRDGAMAVILARAR